MDENPATRAASQDVNWAKLVFYVGCVSVVWAGLWMLSGGWTTVIDPKAIVKYLQDKTPISFLVPAFQTVLWQPLAAIAAVFAVSKPLGKSFDYVVARTKAPEFLNVINRKNADRFVKRKLPLIARDRELQLLREFIDDRRRFAWCWLTGPGMQGKTRIAVETSLKLASGEWGRRWRRSHVGFLGAGQTAEYWKTWQPQRPTVIVIDEAASRPSDAEQLLSGLAQRAHNLKSLVRVVLVERQVPEALVKLGSNQLLQSASYRKIEMVDFEGDERKRFFGEVLKRSLRVQGAEGATPLFDHRARLRGLTAVESMLPFLSDSIIADDQLTLFIASRRLARWKNAGVDDRALVLAAASTLLNGLDWEYADDLAGEKSSDLVLQLERITYRRASDRIPQLGTGAVDLGLALVILDDRPLPERRNLAALGWRVSPKALLQNIQDCNVFKFKEELYAYFVSPASEGATNAREWVLLISLLIQMQAGPGIDWGALAGPLLEAIERPGPETLTLAGLLAGGEYLALRGSNLSHETVWHYLEAAERAPGKWPDNKTILTASLDLLKEGIRLVAKLGADERSDRIASRVNTLTAVDLQKAQAELAEPIKYSLLKTKLLLRAESLGVLAEYFAAKRDPVNLVACLDELGCLAEMLPSLPIEHAYLAALTIACDSPAVDAQQLSALQAKHSELSALLSHPDKKWENTAGFRRLISEELASVWVNPGTVAQA